MTHTLFEYQTTGAEWLASKSQAMLADDMGLGKTVQAIVAMDKVGASKVLVVCPASVRTNWGREISKFSTTPRDVKVIVGGRQDFLEDGVNIISYDTLVSGQRMCTEAMRIQWDVLVLDEAHYLKERTAKRTKLIYGFLKKKGLIASAKHVWRLTGTPMPNNASELYTHLKSMGVVDQSYWDFVGDFCAGFQSNFGFKVTGVKNAEQLKGLLNQVMLRRKKDQVMTQLPPISFHEILVEKSQVDLDPWFYEECQMIGVDDFLKGLRDTDRSLRSALATVSAGPSARNTNAKHAGVDESLQIVKAFSGSTPTLRKYIGLAKLPNVLDIIEDELTHKVIDKIVLFALHKSVISETADRLAKFNPVVIQGSTTPNGRTRAVDEFQNNPKTRVFIGQIIAAGTGITLTAASEVAFLETDWVPANNAQAAMRCHRIGQTNPVRVRFFTCEKSVDEYVMKTVVMKTAQIAEVIH